MSNVGLPLARIEMNAKILKMVLLQSFKKKKEKKKESVGWTQLWSILRDSETRFVLAESGHISFSKEQFMAM